MPYAGHRVQRAWAQRRENTAGAAGGSRVAIGGKNRALLMVHQLKADAELLYRFQNRYDFPAGHAEDEADAGIIERLGDCLGDSGHCGQSVLT
jgi:hypothetical protein